MRYLHTLIEVFISLTFVEVFISLPAGPCSSSSWVGLIPAAALQDWHVGQQQAGAATVLLIALREVLVQNPNGEFEIDGYPSFLAGLTAIAELVDGNDYAKLVESHSLYVEALLGDLSGES